MKLILKLAQQGAISFDQVDELERKISDLGKIKVTRYKKNTLINSEIEKGELFVVMEYLKETYNRNNEISQRFLKILPDLKEIIIYEDRCRDEDVPTIWCISLSGNLSGLKVGRCHKIVWSLINEF